MVSLRSLVHEYILLLLCNINLVYTFSKLMYIFLIHQNVPQIMLFHLIWWFHRSKDFEAMKAGILAIWPWLSYQYKENTLVDLPSSVLKVVIQLQSNFGSNVPVKIDFKKRIKVVTKLIIRTNLCIDIHSIVKFMQVLFLAAKQWK